jgi:hypothetical protein
MLQQELQISNEYDYLVYITEQCINKGFNFEFYNGLLADDECEICKLQHFALQVALLDNEILNLLYSFENKFWGTDVDSENSYRNLIDLHLNHGNVHFLNLN